MHRLRDGAAYPLSSRLLAEDAASKFLTHMVDTGHCPAQAA